MRRVTWLPTPWELPTTCLCSSKAQVARMFFRGLREKTLPAGPPRITGWAKATEIRHGAPFFIGFPMKFYQQKTTAGNAISREHAHARATVLGLGRPTNATTKAIALHNVEFSLTEHVQDPDSLPHEGVFSSSAVHCLDHCFIDVEASRRAGAQ